MGATVRKLWKLVTRASAQSQQTRPRLRGAFLMAAADLDWRVPAGGIARARKRSLLEVPYRSSAAVLSPSGTPGSNLPWLLPLDRSRALVPLPGAPTPLPLPRGRWAAAASWGGALRSSGTLAQGAGIDLLWPPSPTNAMRRRVLVICRELSVPHRTAASDRSRHPSRAA